MSIFRKKNKFEKVIPEIIEALDYPVLIYNLNKKVPYEINGRDTINLSSILAFIADSNFFHTQVVEFDNIIEVFFMRVTDKKNKYVIVIKDDKSNSVLKSCIKTLCRFGEELDHLIVDVPVKITDEKNGAYLFRGGSIDESLLSLEKHNFIDQNSVSYNDTKDYLARINQLEEQNNDLLYKLAEAQKHENFNETDNTAELKKQIMTLKDEAANCNLLQTRLNSAESLLSDRDKVINRLTKEIENLRSSGLTINKATGSASLETDIDNIIVNERLQVLEQHTINLQIKLHEKEQEVILLKDSNPAELEKLRKKLDELSNENDRLKIYCDEKNKSISMLEEKLRLFLDEKNRTIQELKDESILNNNKFNNLMDILQRFDLILNGLPSAFIIFNSSGKVSFINKRISDFSTAEITKNLTYLDIGQYLNIKGASDFITSSINHLLVNKNNSSYMEKVFIDDKNSYKLACFSITNKNNIFELGLVVTKQEKLVPEKNNDKMISDEKFIEIKSSYLQLKEEHGKILDKYNRLKDLSDALNSTDKDNIIVSTRKELAETKIKLMRASEIVKNYKLRLDEQILRYTDLNKRVLVQMDKVVSMLRVREDLANGEIKSIINTLSEEFVSVKAYLASSTSQKSSDFLT